MSKQLRAENERLKALVDMAVSADGVPVVPGTEARHVIKGLVVGRSIAGHGADLIVCDDLVKGG